jgi:hypothetical protein
MGGWEAETSEIDTRRLAELHRHQVLDTPEEAAYDRITELAARLFEAPIAVVSFVDRERLWFKSHFGLNISEAIRDDRSFCTHTILSDQVMVVGDAARDGRFRRSPIVVGGCKIRFYAGARSSRREDFASVLWRSWTRGPERPSPKRKARRWRIWPVLSCMS